MNFITCKRCGTNMTMIPPLGVFGCPNPNCEEKIHISKTFADPRLDFYKSIGAL